MNGVLFLIEKIDKGLQCKVQMMCNYLGYHIRVMGFDKLINQTKFLLAGSKTARGSIIEDDGAGLGGEEIGIPVLSVFFTARIVTISCKSEAL